MSPQPPGSRVGRSWREAVTASAGDAFVRHHVAPAAVREVRTGHGWWAVDLAATSYFSDGCLLLGGDPGAVGAVVQPLAEALGAPEVTVDVAVDLRVGDPARGSEWAWMHASHPLPPVAGEERVLWSPEPAVVDALLDEANPDAYVRPGDGRSTAWAAVVDDDGRALACGAVTEHTPGVPHLASIAVSPTARRQGLGAALTAAMTRRLLRTSPVVTLALWAGNTKARALYDRIGYTGGHDYRTRRLP